MNLTGRRMGLFVLSLCTHSVVQIQRMSEVARAHLDRVCARALRRFPFALHSAGSTRFEQPLRSVDQAMSGGVDLRYYSTPIHAAAFVLPEFARRLFG